MKAHHVWLMALVACGLAAGCSGTASGPGMSPGTASASLGFGALLARTLLLLAAVSVLAVVTLRWAAARGVGTGSANRRLNIIDRVPLSPRQSIVAVRAGDRVLLVGMSPGRFDRLGELSHAAWEQAGASAGAALSAAESADPSPSFAALLDDEVVA